MVAGKERTGRGNSDCREQMSNVLGELHARALAPSSEEESEGGQIRN